LNTSETLYGKTVAEWNNGRGKILAVIGVGWFLSIGVRLTYPVLLPFFESSYGLTLSTSGLLLTVLWISYALGQIPSGLLSTRFGEGEIMAAGQFVAAMTLTLVVFGGSTIVLFLSTILFGLATALFGVAHLSAISDIYPDHRGKAIGLIAATGDVGNAVLPPIAGILAATVAWQLGLGFSIPLFLVAGVGLWVIVPRQSSPPDHSSETTIVEKSRYVLSALNTPSILLIVTIQILGLSIWQAFTGFFPTYLVTIKGLSPTIASGLYAVFFGLGVFVRPLSGTAFDRVGAQRTLYTVMGFTLSGLVVLPLLDGFWPMVAATVVLSTMLGRGTITMAYMTAALPDDILNTGLGTIRTTYMATSALSPAIFGAIADRGFFDEAFFLLAAVAALAMVFIYLLPEP
jgi:MFS family permease